MKNTKINLIHFLSALSFASLLLRVSAQTNSTDVEALGLLQTAFPLLRLQSTGDPCLPTPFSWVQCSSDVAPRIVALNLGGSSVLVGVFLPDFSAMDALEIIDFSNNFLLQDFPDFFANFPKLKELNLANNFLFGTVPISLMIKANEKTLNLTLTGMVNLCFSDGSECETVTDTETLGAEAVEAASVNFRVDVTKHI